VDSRRKALDKMDAEGILGLQAWVSPSDLKWITEAWKQSPGGGLIVQRHPAYRSDAMPYGGVSDSGTGDKRARAAMARVLCLAHV